MSTHAGIDGSARCPHCSALVRQGADWCSLCYADLRPAPQPVRDPVPQQGTAAPPVAGAPAFDPLTAPLALLEGFREVQPDAAPAASAAVPAVPAAPVAATQPAAGWPCTRCKTTVPLEESACPSCGAGFLQGAIAYEPVLGRVGGGLSQQTRAFIMIGGALGLVAVLLGVMYVVGALL